MTATHCPYCALQCAMSVAPADPGVTPTVTPLEFPTNRGRLCQKGWTSAEVLTTPDRLTSPLVRRDGELVPTDWDTALTLVATTGWGQQKDRERALEAGFDHHMTKPVELGVLRDILLREFAGR